METIKNPAHRIMAALGIAYGWTKAERDKPCRVNPPGSKLLKSFYRAKHGTKPTGDKDTTPLQEARRWYAQLEEPKYRQGRDPARLRDALHAMIAMQQRR